MHATIGRAGHWQANNVARMPAISAAIASRSGSGTGKEKIRSGLDALLPLLLVTPSTVLAGVWHGKAPGSEFRASTRLSRHMEPIVIASASRFIIHSRLLGLVLYRQSNQ